MYSTDNWSTIVSAERKLHYVKGKNKWRRGRGHRDKNNGRHAESYKKHNLYPHFINKEMKYRNIVWLSQGHQQLEAEKVELHN